MTSKRRIEMEGTTEIENSWKLYQPTICQNYLTNIEGGAEVENVKK